MELATHKRRFSPRLKPLAACLAAALALGAGSVAADAKALPNQQQFEASLPARMKAAHLRPPPGWQAPQRPHSLLDRDFPVPHAIPAVPTASIPVTNCNDSGSGSLRDAIVNLAADGDTIDMTGLTCGGITLTTGSILFGQNSLTLQGPGVNNLYLSGGVGSARVAPLLHDGTGTLTINDMTIADGAKYFTSSQIDDARGGCIFSSGFVDLNDAEVKYCTAQNTGNYNSLGGAVYAASGIGLSNTLILDSSASATNQFAEGGGIFTPGAVTILDSVIDDNSVSGAGGGVVGYGGGLVKYSSIINNYSGYSVGGIYLHGNATIENSTIAANTAAGKGGGIWFNGTGATAPVTLLSSTVSGNNSATSDSGGVFLYGGLYTSRIANSTIAFNTTHFTSYLKYGAGVHGIDGTVDLESNIIAGNTNDEGSGPVNDDIDGYSFTLTGANNLIVSASVTPPSDTISADPKLQPLANNGGTTETHAIAISSPALNAGNNAAAVSFDQRGSGFPRVSGSQADIGAYEFNLDDVIFRDGFDG